MHLSDKRQAIIELVKAKTMKQSAAAETLGVRVRQIKRLCRTARQMGLADNRIPELVKQKIIKSKQEQVYDQFQVAS
jgi:transposase